MNFDQPGSTSIGFDGTYEILTDYKLNQVILEGEDSSKKVVETPEGRPRSWEISTGAITIVTRGSLIDFFQHADVNFMAKPFYWTPIGNQAAVSANSSNFNIDGYFYVRLVRPISDRRIGNGWYTMSFQIEEEV